MELVKLKPINRICPNCGNGNYMRIIDGKNVGKLNVKCINCNNYYNYDELLKCDNSKLSNGVGKQTIGDLISRSAALDVLVTSPNFHTILTRIEELPAVDAVPVVRCRDCKYGKLCFDADGHGLIQCTNTNYPAANVETWPLELDWYCAGGERRDSDA